MNDGGHARRGPHYFLEVQAAAKRRWEQLEADPELAGPWRQLFKQVQVPRHVLSELLQNADDAGASYVSARIENDTFIFEHDGEDFTKEQFESLCRFGFSNKRKLHTIGFRGIGFKSTFSLGKTVQLFTPTLSVEFNERRFTEPVWVEDAAPTSRTRIIVRIEDVNRRAELCKNLEEWSKSPVSLLFFNNIRRLDILGRTVERNILGEGPVPGSEEITLTGKKTLRLTVFHSPEEPFPEESIAEIRQEKISEDITFPACPVDLVVGLEEPQRLYVILPTEVCCDLPFSCNAPFIQDPARTGIKDPAISPTNRWLLKRIGRLAAEAMVSTLKNRSLPIIKRVQAYDLLPNPEGVGSSVDGEAVRLIRESFVESIPKDEILLTSEGDLYPRDRCVAPPYDLADIWVPAQLLTILGKEDRGVLATEVLPVHRKRLVAWKYLQITPDSEILARLESCAVVPRPRDWQCLSKLWMLIKSWTSEDWDNSVKKKLKIMPVEDSALLCPANDVVRLSSAKSKLVEEDWCFVTERLHVLDRDWISYLTTHSVQIGAGQSSSYEPPLRQILKLVGLSETTQLETILARTFRAIREAPNFSAGDLMRLTAIIATLDMAVPSGFEYLVRNGNLRKVEDGVAADLRGELELIIQKGYAESHLLHPDYFSALNKQAKTQWQSWIDSPQSGLRSFAGLVTTVEECGQYQLERFVNERRGMLPAHLRQKLPLFRVKDRDFDPVLLSHWSALAVSDSFLWVRILRLIMRDPGAYWKRQKNVQVFQMRKNEESAISCGEMPARWILRLRELACLEDTYGIARIPAELLIRTPETEALRDLEAFVCAETDIPSNRELLKLLGTRETPTNLDKLLDRLRALATIKGDVPILEIANWYKRLDQILPKCNSEELMSIRDSFASERLVLSSECTWCTAKEIFLHSDDQELPGISVVHPTVQNLSLWIRLGVADRPTIDLVLGWLKQLKSGSKLDAQNVRRVRLALQRCATRVWEECKHGLSLDGSWVHVSEFKFRMTMAQLSRFADLFPGIRSQTADLRMLSMELCGQPPFSALMNLGDAIECRISEVETGTLLPVTKNWIKALGMGLRRIKLEDESETKRVRDFAKCLAETQWQPVKTLKVTPCISGTPAGEAFTRDVLWHERLLYVAEDDVVKFFDSVVDELAKPFALPQIEEIIRSCVEREGSFVESYLRCNFELEEETVAESKDDITIESKDLAVGPGEVTVAGAGSADSEMIDAAEEQPDSITSGGEEAAVSGEAEEVAPAQRTNRIKVSLITEYAHAKGFLWDNGKGRYIHSSGAWLQKSDGGFQWERYDIEGNVQCRYWVSDKCLSTEGVQISAALWELIKKEPVFSALVLRNEDRKPLLIKGEDLVEKVRKGEAMLYPANYSLCLKPEIV